MTGAVWVGLAAGLAALGLALVVAGLVPAVPEPVAGHARTPLRARLAGFWQGLTPGQRRLVSAALAAGALAYVLTGWAPALVLLPALVVALPLLLADPPNRRIELLAALDRWVRALAASIPTGKSIPDALRATRRQAPGPLAAPVTLLAQRLAERWPVPEALRAFADDCGSADVDAVAAALIVAADRGGLGATATLEALADSVQMRLAAARDIETERAKPRIVVRQVVGIIVAVIVVVLATSPGYFEPYMHGLGTLVLVLLLAVFLGALLKLRLSGLPPASPRLLVQRAGSQTPAGGGGR